ncbi:MAG: exonuclease SbcCD subunit D C-terminal domain-containing protein [Holophagales bacterium]|nr:exonuclease SbcCD subunit D C-terminal domain-containing protein [Holophagales bacterium]
MKLLHTSDWHLGHTLLDADREVEHDEFLSWLLDTIEAHEVDALLVTGDIFDSANPPATAQRAWYRFLVEAGRRRKGLQVVAIAGNHDSAARLEAPREVLASLDVTVVGELPCADGRLDPARLLVPLRDREGVRRAWVAAVPYLRSSDLAGFGEEAALEDDGSVRIDPNATRVAAVYAEASALVRSRRTDGEAVVLTGHLYAAGGHLSEISERKIQKGNQEAVALDVFGSDVGYVALGHLHLAQTVGGRENVRYAGSPIPLSLDEAGYPHQVVLVTLADGRATSVEAVRVPRSVPILRLPEGGSLPLAGILPILRALPPDPDPERREPDRRPFLEVRLVVEAGEPGWKSAIQDAVAGKDARLLRVDPTSTGSGSAPHEQTERSLSDVTPEEVFRMKYAKEHEGEPSPELLAAFHDLVGEAEAER